LKTEDLEKKIVILSPGRSGTTLLINSLQNHPELRIPTTHEPLCLLAEVYSYYHDFIRKEFGIDPSKYKMMSRHLINQSVLDILACPKYLSKVFEDNDIWFDPYQNQNNVLDAQLRNAGLLIEGSPTQQVTNLLKDGEISADGEIFLQGLRDAYGIPDIVHNQVKQEVLSGETAETKEEEKPFAERVRDFMQTGDWRSIFQSEDISESFQGFFERFMSSNQEE